MLIIFDLDDTLVHVGGHESSPKICPETEKVLAYLKSKNHVLAIASHNLEAKKIATEYHLDQYLDIILGECPPCYTKTPLIMKILDMTMFNKNDVVYFDDLYEMTSNTKRNGIRTKLVDYRYGVTMDDIISMYL